MDPGRRTSVVVLDSFCLTASMAIGDAAPNLSYIVRNSRDVFDAAVCRVDAASIWSSSALYNGIMCMRTVRGGCSTGLASSTSFILYFSPGNYPILSKHSCSTFCFVNAVTAGMCLPLSLSTFSVTRPSSWAWLLHSMAGLPDVLTTLKSASRLFTPHNLHRSRSVIFDDAATYFISMQLLGLTFMSSLDLYSSSLVMVHVSDPVSTLRFVLYVSLSITLTNTLSLTLRSSPTRHSKTTQSTAATVCIASSV